MTALVYRKTGIKVIGSAKALGANTAEGVPIRALAIP